MLHALDREVFQHPRAGETTVLLVVAHVGHRGHAFRGIVITGVGGRDQSRSEATQCVC
jgi:hypothetical protein